MHFFWLLCQRGGCCPSHATKAAAMRRWLRNFYLGQGFTAGYQVIVAGADV